MKVHKAYKVELDPNNKQRTMFNKCAGTTRFIYNWGLAEWKSWYDAGGNPSVYSLRRYFNSFRHVEYPWMEELPYAIIEATFGNLGGAFKNFFRRVKNGENKVGYPRFKKKGRDDSFQLRSTHVENNQVRLTHIGWVRLKECNYIPTTDSGAKFGIYTTISKQANRWYISVQVEEEIPEPKDIKDFALGVDLGINSLAVCSDGTVFENPHALQQEEHKLKRLQRELSRRKKGSQNWKKTKDKIARCHKRIADIRMHALHQVSHYVTAETKPKAVVLEDLNVSGMMQNRHLSKAISDVGFHELRRQTEYKAKWYGVDFVLANRFYPSSKTCSECGAVKSVLKLSERQYVCEECGTIIDRDLNAAINLAALAEGGNTAGLPRELECCNAPL